MTAHKIPPQTMIPTAHAAIHEPCHIVRMTWPCLVTGTSRPCLVNAVDLQPVVSIATPASTAARGAQRRTALRLGLTDRLPSGPFQSAQSAAPVPVLQAVVQTVQRPSRRPPRTPAYGRQRAVFRRR